MVYCAYIQLIMKTENIKKILTDLSNLLITTFCSNIIKKKHMVFSFLTYKV
jgi:hypothetical protein